MIVDLQRVTGTTFSLNPDHVVRVEQEPGDDQAALFRTNVTDILGKTHLVIGSHSMVKRILAGGQP